MDFQCCIGKLLIYLLMAKVNYMGGPGKGQFAKLGNQITIASTMVGLVEGMVYAHKAGLDVGMFVSAISTGAAGSKDFDARFYVNHFRMGLALPGLALAQQLYLSLKAHGEGNLGIQALILALEAREYGLLQCMRMTSA
ncbi:hypothetical protein ACJRO7_014060 [Eucalyptus globulus]|uniref:3-hydroxyisobutyrate dehydrogenase-like NAD-binding domain-containing protein n=1 Tax=Eucalyptus globulus TaxID=34317 RepID=A0ABD3KYW3_EUCGL